MFVTYKANRDSAVFNADRYKELLRKVLGLRTARPSYMKEVVIDDPDYAADAQRLHYVSRQAKAYTGNHRLKALPNPIDVFFRYQPDNDIADISEQLETTIADLANSRDKVIVSTLSKYPVVATKAHTRPFDHKWMNIAAAVLVPIGIFFYLRMCRYRRRLNNDLALIQKHNDTILTQINKMSAGTHNADTHNEI